MGLSPSASPATRRKAAFGSSLPGADGKGAGAGAGAGAAAALSTVVTGKLVKGKLSAVVEAKLKKQAMSSDAALAAAAAAHLAKLQQELDAQNGLLAEELYVRMQLFIIIKIGWGGWVL